MNRAVDRSQEAPERRRGAVTEDGALTTGENRCHPAAVKAQSGVPDCVDPLMNTVQPPLLRPF